MRGTRQLVDELLLVLRAECALLVKGDTAELAAQARRKAALLLELGPALVQGAPADIAPLRASIAEARRLNDLNARLVSTRMALVRARADVLLPQAAGVYGARGDLTSLRGGGHAVTHA